MKASRKVNVLKIIEHFSGKKKWIIQATISYEPNLKESY